MKKYHYFLLFILNNVVLSYVIYLCYQDTLGTSLYDPPFSIRRLIIGVLLFGSPFWISNIFFIYLFKKESKNYLQTTKDS